MTDFRVNGNRSQSIIVSFWMNYQASRIRHYKKYQFRIVSEKQFEIGKSVCFSLLVAEHFVTASLFDRGTTRLCSNRDGQLKFYVLKYMYIITELGE